jgi:hypothetical protein
MCWSTHHLVFLVITLFHPNVYSLPSLSTNMSVATGRVIIIETLNFTKIEDHLQLWAKEMSHTTSQTDHLIAAKTMRELRTLKSTLLNVDLTPTDGSLHRKKRNVIGDFLNYVGGVATEDQLKNQLKIDHEIREKIKNTLTKQIAFEQTLTNLYQNISQEEITIHQKMERLTLKMKRESLQRARIGTLMQIANTDRENMEDCLEAIWKGEVSPRHAARLALQAGLDHTPHLRLERYSSCPMGLTLNYSSILYDRVEMLTEMTGNGLQVWHNDLSYLLHRGHPVSSPITERDVLYFPSASCSECALVVHIDRDLYKVTRSGSLVCNGLPLNQTEGDRLTLPKDRICWNQKIKIDSNRILSKQYHLDLSASNLELDALLARRALSSPQSYLTFCNNERQLLMSNYNRSFKKLSKTSTPS